LFLGDFLLFLLFVLDFFTWGKEQFLIFYTYIIYHNQENVNMGYVDKINLIFSLEFLYLADFPGRR